MKRDFSEKFEREKFDGGFIGKVELHYICYLFVKSLLSLCIFIYDLLSFIYHIWQGYGSALCG